RAAACERRHVGRRGRSLRQCGVDALAQAGGSPETQVGLADRLAHLAIGGELGSAGRTGRDMRFDLARVAGIELAIDQRVKKDACLVAGHFACSCSASHAERSMARARARRDITVPTGAPTASAISRYERLLISRNTKVSLKGSASASTIRLIAEASRSRNISASGVCCSSCQSGVCSAASGLSSIALAGALARLANSARQTLRRIASSHGFI